jgi:hypothetical protein
MNTISYYATLLLLLFSSRTFAAPVIDDSNLRAEERINDINGSEKRDLANVIDPKRGNLRSEGQDQVAQPIFESSSLRELKKKDKSIQGFECLNMKIFIKEDALPGKEHKSIDNAKIFDSDLGNEVGRLNTSVEKTGADCILTGTLSGKYGQIMFTGTCEEKKVAIVGGTGYYMCAKGMLRKSEWPNNNGKLKMELFFCTGCF